ncbi:MAG: DUF5658 family protein [Chloroflexota bacterium]
MRHPNISSAGGYTIRILLGALFSAVVADSIITEYLVYNGLALEANPLLQFWVGKDAFLTFKLLGGLLASIYLYFIYRRHPTISISLSSFFLAFYTGIILWNLLILV